VGLRDLQTTQTGREGKAGGGGKKLRKRELVDSTDGYRENHKEKKKKVID